MLAFLVTRLKQSFCSVSKIALLARTIKTIFFLFGIIFMIEVRPISLVASAVIPIMTIAALMITVREFPHTTSKNKFLDKKPYSQYGNNTSFYVLHLHGWRLAHADSYAPQSEDDVYIVSPRFSETLDKKLFSTCLGQERDVLQTLVSLKETHHVTHAIHTIAHCRGAAVFINMLCVLSTPEHNLLKEARINEKERIVIMNKIVAGSTILISPLLSVAHFIRDWFTPMLAPIIHKHVLPWLTKYQYNPQGMCTLNSTKNLKISIPITIIFPEYDDSIGTGQREEFKKILKQQNGNNNTRIFLIKGEKKHWPPFLKNMPYHTLFKLFSFERKPTAICKKMAKLGIRVIIFEDILKQMPYPALFDFAQNTR
jgi:hypothetical protein